MVNNSGSKRKPRGASSNLGPIGGANLESQGDGMLPELRVAFAKFVEVVRVLPRPAFLSPDSLSRIVWNRRFLQLTGVLIIFFVVKGLDVKWAERSSEMLDRVSAPVAAVTQNLQQPVRERSAFFIVDDFDNGLENWLGAESSTLSEAGLLKVNGLALYRDTMKLHSYRMDFDFEITSGALGWVVRASDPENYYAFKLSRKGGKDSPSYQLRRYTVLGGSPLPLPVEEASVPSQFLKEGFNTISVRVRRNVMNTLFNGNGIDHWVDSHFTQGGVGFFAGDEDSAFVRHVAVTGNEDVLGLILFGTVQTIRSIREFVSAPLAFTLRPHPAGPVW